MRTQLSNLLGFRLAHTPRLDDQSACVLRAFVYKQQLRPLCQAIMDEEDTKFELEIENIVESDDFTIFNQEDLPMGGFQVMEEIRRKGKLCDVTLKVSGKRDDSDWARWWW